MKPRDQGGYTLVELIITIALGAVLMSALTSVVYTAFQGANIAQSRIEASTQIRNFQQFAYDDFAQSSIAGFTSCDSPCTRAMTVGSVSYMWDPSTNLLDRSAGGAAKHVATNVTDFSARVDANSTVVVRLTVTVHGYSESQAYRFYPRLNP